MSQCVEVGAFPFLRLSKYNETQWRNANYAITRINEFSTTNYYADKRITRINVLSTYA
jgi:hypothetical protein